MRQEGQLMGDGQQRREDLGGWEIRKGVPKHSKGKISNIEAGKPPGEGPPPVTTPDPQVTPPNSQDTPPNSGA
jgi:hypothetical protein